MRQTIGGLGGAKPRAAFGQGRPKRVRLSGGDFKPLRFGVQPIRTRLYPTLTRD